MGPQLALGDGALGFWKALRQVYPGAREQRCWVHKTGNVLNKLPKGLQKKAKGRLQDIWMAETRKDAESAFDFFLGLRAEVRQGRGLPGQGPRRPADVLRLPRRALEACTHDQPLSPRFVCAPTGPRAACRARRWPWSSNYASALRENGENSMDRGRRDHSRRQIPMDRQARRRMISPYTTFDNSSVPFWSAAAGSISGGLLLCRSHRRSGRMCDR